MAHYQGAYDEKQQQYQDASRLKEKVEIYISCRDLLSLDYLRYGHAILFILAQEHLQSVWWFASYFLVVFCVSFLFLHMERLIVAYRIHL